MSMIDRSSGRAYTPGVERRWLMAAHFTRTLVALACFSIALTAEDGRTTFIREKTLDLYSEAVKIRRDLHRIPEPCLQETKTSQYIAAYLEKLGLEIETGIAETGIKAVLRGGKPGPTVGIRGDMDGLPLQENTGLTFTSAHPGFMHACGHDAHMTNVLISAKILSEMRERIAGTIVFIFQPCEEGNTAGKSGAHLMIEAGVLENPRIEAMLGLHVMPEFPVGSVALRPGPLMANVVFFEVVIKGKSSHGALPHQGIDAVHISALAIQQFQAIISRLKDPGERAVLSVGSIHGGTAANIISDRVVMRGTVRSFSFETENAIEKQMRNVLEGLALTYGMEFDFEFDRSAQHVHNDPELTAVVTKSFQETIGAQNVLSTEPMTIAEDFSAFSHTIPSVFFFLGTGTEEKLHSTDFSVDEEIFKTGPLLFCTGALRLLEHLSDRN